MFCILINLHAMLRNQMRLRFHLIDVLFIIGMSALNVLVLNYFAATTNNGEEIALTISIPVMLALSIGYAVKSGAIVGE